jgi:hypothetical protein
VSCNAPKDIADDAWLSQLGKRVGSGEFRFACHLRPHKEPPERDLSFILGKFAPAEARRIAYGTLTRLRPGYDAVRYVKAGTLRSVGFRVDHTPRHGGGLLHVSVFWDGGEWDDTVAELLHSCCMEGVI